ncbi:MAG: HAD-IB family phosphatase [Candidatus Kapabacteria bacterium]|jgi:D-3-phosphoglycerate dehydrogenase|nr:HAD-IB family phosphatase [Candidatus Kapabacteria bacterium]
MQDFSTIIIDFDSTLVQVESLEDLAAIALADAPDRAERVQAITDLTNQAMSGALRFDEALARRIPLLGARKEHISALVQVLNGKITPSLLQNLTWFQANRERLYVVSGGFREFIVPVMEPLGFKPEHIFANTFLFDEQGNITGADQTNFLSQEDGKTALLKHLNLPRPRLIIGDGFSDYQLRASGECEAFYVLTENVHRLKVVECADRVLTSFDALLQELPPAQS